jgi:hypothetical protein
VNGYLRLWLAGPLLSACCCWRRYLCRSLGELNTHLALQALFIQSSPVCKLLLQAFPFPSTLGEVTLHLLSQACCLFTVHWEVVFLHFLWSFPPTATFTSLPAPGFWACAAAPAFSGLVCLFTAHVGSGSSPLSCGVFLPLPLLQAFPLLDAGCVLLLLPSLARLVYLQFCEGFLSPALQCSGHPTLFATCLFFVVIAYYSVFLFSLGGGRSVQGAMLIWPRLVCGSTTYRLAHLVVCVFPSGLGTVWQRRGSPPVFSV